MDNNQNNKLEAKFDFGKWFENFWYHYKIQALIAIVLIVTVVVSSVQLATRKHYDYYFMYAGPAVLALQDLTYIQRALEIVSDDYDGNGAVAVSIDDIVMLSPEEREASSAAGAMFNPDFLRNTMTEYYQQIVGGSAVVCMLSPYMYEMVKESGGFMPLSEIYGEVPEEVRAIMYDECGVILSKTEFGQAFNGIDDLPEDTVLCVRRLSTMAIFKGEEKTRALHEASVGVFKNIISYKKEA